MGTDPADPNAQDAFADDLRRAADGDNAARQRLWNDHYVTFHDSARRWLAHRWQQRGDEQRVSLGATDIVHAAYERLHDRTAAMANGRPFFFRALYTEFLRIVVDHYRTTRNDKGRGNHRRVEFQSQFLADHGMQPDFDVLYEILGELGALDERLGQVAMLKVFETRPSENGTGEPRSLTNGEVAELLGLGLRTVEKDWSFAKAWLLKRVAEADG